MKYFFQAMALLCLIFFLFVPQDSELIKQLTFVLANIFLVGYVILNKLDKIEEYIKKK